MKGRLIQLKEQLDEGIVHHLAFIPAELTLIWFWLSATFMNFIIRRKENDRN